MSRRHGGIRTCPPPVYKCDPCERHPQDVFLSFSHLLYSRFRFNTRQQQQLLKTYPNMRSPIIAFSIVAAAAVSPSLVSAAPASPNLASGLAPAVPHTPQLATRQLDVVNGESRAPHTHKQHARVDDSQTAGGNAFTGSSSDVNGGSIYNESEDNTDTITNTASSAYKNVDILQHTHCFSFFKIPPVLVELLSQEMPTVVTVVVVARAVMHTLGRQEMQMVVTLPTMGPVTSPMGRAAVSRSTRR